MSAQDGVIAKRRVLAPLANGVQRKIAAPSGKALAAAVKGGAIVGSAAVGLRLLASMRAPVPASFRASLSEGHGPAAAAELALIRRLVPEAIGVTGKDPFDIAIQVLGRSGNHEAAQELLNARAKSMREFFDGWSESMRRNAQLDKEAAMRSHKLARAERTIHRVRRRFNAYLTKQGATGDQLIPSSKRTSAAVGSAGVTKAQKVGGAARQSAAEHPSDSYEGAGASTTEEPSHTRALEKPDADIGVHTGPKKRGLQAYLR